MRGGIMFLAFLGGLLSAHAAHAAERLVLEVRETAGIERFHYPVTAQFSLPADVPRGTPFRLLNGKREIAAQATPPEENLPPGQRRWALDFGIDLAPHETRRLVLEYGDGVAATEPMKRGLRLVRTDDLLRVRHPSLEFVVPANLDGLFESIRVSGDAWLVGRSAGLTVQTRDGKRVDLRFSAPRVTKVGPLAAAIEFSAPIVIAVDRKVDTRVTLDFPLGKSWVKVACTLDDPRDQIAAASAALKFRLEADGRPPVMAAVGAAGWTYAALAPGQLLRYHAKSASEWIVERGEQKSLRPYVAPPGAGSPAAEGWGHLMDAKRATAVAMADFANGTSDTMEFGADGALQLRREFPAAQNPATPKRLAFWLHVVASPPQWGAATSPQSMLAPPEVRVVDRAKEAPR
jgi:hypothetical protein